MESNEFICSKCVYDEFLSAQIKEKGTKRRCRICGSKGPCYTVDKIADIVAKAFNGHYKVGEEFPRSYPNEDNPKWEQLGNSFEEIIREIFDAEEQAVEAVILNIKTVYSEDLSKGSHNSLEEDKFVKDDIDDFEFNNNWEAFCQKIKHSTRFFSNDLIEFLDQIFNGIEEYQAAEDGRPSVSTIKPGDDYSTIYRARQADSGKSRIEILLNPHKQLSAPPPETTKAGRINPAGIPVLYASLKDEKTCLKENCYL
jgi:hypothetical protein